MNRQEPIGAELCNTLITLHNHNMKHLMPGFGTYITEKTTALVSDSLHCHQIPKSLHVSFEVQA
eukprot:372469-Hanusia_phi.AAC.1